MSTQYKSISIDGVIAKIIRDTRVQDSSYISDMHEWIPEAMGLMKTNAELYPKAAIVPIQYHMGKLPCGLIYVDAVEYQGKRMRYYNGVRRPGTFTTTPTAVDESAPFESVITANVTVNNDAVIDSTLVAPTVDHPDARYQIHLDHLVTTFEDGEVVIHFHTIALDDRGLPLIPDHPDYKEALYWFVRTKMIQAGYDDPMYRNDDRIPDSRWEKHAARAISDILYPTPDQKESQIAMHVRFVPPTDYYESFFNSTLGEGAIGI